MPKEYIEREALMNQIRLTASRTNLGEIKPNNISGMEICGLILNAPAADVVKVVRCDKCKHLTVHNSPTLYAYCEKTHFRFEPFQTDTRTHFCGFGERKDGAENETD